jgi:thiosulfate dehydrogenase [quinone] large subunit
MNEQKVPPARQPFITPTGPTRVTPWRAKGIALLRIVFGIVWGIAAWLKWQPGFISSFTDQVTGSKDEQPAAVQSWITWWGNLVSTNPHFFAYLLACTETAIALFFIFGILTNLTCVVSILLSLGIWSTAQGFGGPIQPGKSTDIGTSIIYAIVAAILLVIAAGRYYSVDQWLTPRLGHLGVLASGPLWNHHATEHA